MNNKQLLGEIRETVLEESRKDLVSLYAIGSFISKDMVRTSDIDLIGIFRDDFNFRKEKQINKALNEKIKSSHRIDMGTVSIREFYGGKRKGSIMKYVTLSVFLNFLKRAKLIYGKKLDFYKFPVKPASLYEELKYHAGLITRYGKKFREIDKIGVDWYFRDFIKTVFHIADIELQLTRKTKPKRSYMDIVKALEKDKKHIIHESIRLRKKRIISNREKQRWIDAAEKYAKYMRKNTTVHTTNLKNQQNK